jgi:hypothetical protein
MRSLLALALTAVALACAEPPRAQRLVLDLDLEQDVLSVSHAIDGFLFPPTANRSPFSDRDLNASAPASHRLRVLELPLSRISPPQRSPIRTSMCV